MKVEKIITWLDETLKVADFDDVSNNGLQVDRLSASEIGQSADRQISNLESQILNRGIEESNNRTVSTVAFAVDASVRAVEAAAKAGAELLVVHHGISWGGGVKRVTGGVGRVVRAAIENDVAIYACHLPLDAHSTLGNNAQLAKILGLKRVKPAFNYHGNVIGLVGNCSIVRLFRLFDCLNMQQTTRENLMTALRHSNRTIEQSEQSNNLKIGLCSGGAGEFAEEAKRLGCDLYLTGEASWGDVIAAENCDMKMLCLGHYETEVWGVRAVAKAMKRALKVKTVDLTETLRPNA